jgi:hypothetical protein
MPPDVFSKLEKQLVEVSWKPCQRARAMRVRQSFRPQSLSAARLAHELNWLSAGRCSCIRGSMLEPRDSMRPACCRHLFRMFLAHVSVNRLRGLATRETKAKQRLADCTVFHLQSLHIFRRTPWAPSSRILPRTRNYAAKSLPYVIRDLIRRADK